MLFSCTPLLDLILKFVDCAIVANADYTVAQDTNFDVLKKNDFPKVNVIRIEEFVKELN